MRATRAVIDLAAIRDNYRYAGELAPRSRTLPVIKADAYGHGLLEVAHTLAPLAPGLAVAILDEAIALREAGLALPVLVLEGPRSADAFAAARARDLTVMLHEPGQLAALKAAGGPIKAWLKLDTGMHRLGFSAAALPGVLAELRRGGLLAEPPVLCTHLACADQPGNAHTQTQLGRFAAATCGLEGPRSIANSAAILAWPASHAEWNRAGYLLYGASPLSVAHPAAPRLRPAMRFEAELIALREIAAGESVGYGARWTAGRPTLIATVAVGYGDGYPRQAPNGTPVLIKGRIAPLVGTVSMDMITLDVSDHQGLSPGDTVELWGAGLPIRRVAEALGTIGYELMTRLTARVPRVYVNKTPRS